MICSCFLSGKPILSGLELLFYGQPEVVYVRRAPSVGCARGCRTREHYRTCNSFHFNELLALFSLILPHKRASPSCLQCFIMRCKSVTDLLSQLLLNEGGVRGGWALRAAEQIGTNGYELCSSDILIGINIRRMTETRKGVLESGPALRVCCLLSGGESH